MGKIVFYNGFHVGDIVISKPIVRELIKFFPDKKPFYAHNNNPIITSDLCEYISPTDIRINNDIFIQEYNDTLIVNTWLGSTQNKALKIITNSNPDIAHLDFQIIQFNYLLRQHGYNINLDYLLDKPDRYIWDLKDIYLPTNFVIPKEKKVLIFNMPSLSGQADNIDQTEFIVNIANKFPKIKFCTTNIDISLSNILYLGKDITQRGLDLFQFAEFSKRCNIIVGNGSGPLMFTWIKDNIMDPKKIYIINHKINDGECKLYSKQPAVSIRTTSTKQMFITLEEKLNELQ